MEPIETIPVRAGASTVLEPTSGKKVLSGVAEQYRLAERVTVPMAE